MFQAYSSGPKQEEREKVLWVKFEDCDVNGVYSYWLHTHVHMHARTTGTHSHTGTQANGHTGVCQGVPGWLDSYNMRL